MRYCLYITLIICFVCFSCGKKQEMKVYKNSQTRSSDSTAEQSDTILKSGEVPGGGGESELSISSSECGNHVGVKAKVSGYVADVVKREKVAYLNFDKKYPKNTFSAVVFEGKFSEVGDLDIYKNKNVEVRGIITEYKGKPQIIISSKNQISIVK